MMLWPQAAFAQSNTPSAPDDVSLDILECSQTTDSQATLSWEKQTGATEYRIYTRLGEDEFGAYDATSSPKIKLPLDSQNISIIAITSVAKDMVNGKNVATESAKSPEFEIDVPTLCQKATPTVTVSPEVTHSASVSAVPQTKDETKQPQNENSSIKEGDSHITQPDNLVKLEQKYTDSKKNQAQIQEKVHSFVSWIKSKVPFLH
jgi:hypothetical protein